MTIQRPPSRRSGKEEHYSGKWAVMIMLSEPTELVSPLCPDEQSAQVEMDRLQPLYPDTPLSFAYYPTEAEVARRQFEIQRIEGEVDYWYIAQDVPIEDGILRGDPISPYYPTRALAEDALTNEIREFFPGAYVAHGAALFDLPREQAQYNQLRAEVTPLH